MYPAGPPLPPPPRPNAKLYLTKLNDTKLQIVHYGNPPCQTISSDPPLPHSVSFHFYIASSQFLLFPPFSIPHNPSWLPTNSSLKFLATSFIDELSP